MRCYFLDLVSDKFSLGVYVLQVTLIQSLVILQGKLFEGSAKALLHAMVAENSEKKTLDVLGLGAKRKLGAKTTCTCVYTLGVFLNQCARF